jgi:hypothetical protein
MTSQFWTLTALSFASAFVPVVNIDAILLAMLVTFDDSSPVLMAAVAASGQMIGKFVFFRAGMLSATGPLTHSVKFYRRCIAGMWLWSSLLNRFRHMPSTHDQKQSYVL